MIRYPRYLFAAGFTVNQHLILIKRQYQGNVPLLAHEQKHQEQMAKVGTWTFWWKYLTDKQFRQDMEVEAYKAQIAAGGSKASAAVNLSTLYRLGITLTTAFNLLEN